jgi:Domain of unknown function (DUF4388)
MSLEGSLGERQLGEVLSTLALHARTGILTVQGASEIIAISFLEGEIVSADALNQSLEDGLGRVLSDLGLVEPGTFAGLAAEHQAGGGRVAELVVERGYLQHEQLLAALRLHIYRLCRQAVSWKEGDFKFYQGDEVTYEVGITPMPVEELYATAARDLGDPELARGSYPEVGSVYARAGTGVGRGLASLDPQVLTGIGPDSGEILAATNGRRSTGEVAASADRPLYRVLYVLYRCEREGLVQEVGHKDTERPELSHLEEISAVTEEPTGALPYVLTASRRASAWPDRMSSLQDRLRSWLPASHLWPARVTGLGLAVAIVWIAATSPLRIVLPLSHEEPMRQRARAARYAASELRIQRAAVTYRLLQGRFPESAAELSDLGLVDDRDLTDESGRAIQFSSTEVSYVAQSAEGEAASAGVVVAGAVTGNFLLDSDFGVGDHSTVAPLVLLD